MFERRLKIVLVFLILAGVALFGRVFQVQVIRRAYWDGQATGVMTHSTLTETTRGRLLDRNGKELTIDVACTDACVDYRAIKSPPDAKWVQEIALDRLKARPGLDYTHQPAAARKTLRAAEVTAVNDDVANMWAMLGKLYVPLDDTQPSVADVRAAIVGTVEARRRWSWTRQQERDRLKVGRASRWLGWLTGGPGGPADFAHFSVVFPEQEQPHVILHDLSPDAYSYLGKRQEQCPGLTLRPSTHRVYPLKTVACHILGSMHPVTAAEVEATKSADETRRYLPSDLAGRDGVEAYAEPILRGSRGRVEKQVGADVVVSRQEFVAGRDVHLSIDAELQAQCQELLRHVVEVESHGQLVTPAEGVSMHAAIVVIDVKTGEVRALASNPGFDANDLTTKYAALLADTENEPLRDRATSDAAEPGSTVKPMVGLSGITAGVVKPTEGIECTGDLYLPAIGPDGKATGKRVAMYRGRCWVASEYGTELKAAGLPIDHHRVPSGNPHRGIDGNPDGWLTVSDAIERSCDVYFETVADRLGHAELCRWYDKFGFGRPTGIGINESPGLIEDQYRGAVSDPRMINCYAGMGQGKTLATPLQVANEAATIARGGVWVRPTILVATDQALVDAARGRDSTNDRVDLKLDPAAVEQVRIGMRNAVDGPAGTGQLRRYYPDRPAWLTVAAKTGTADTSKLIQVTHDPSGVVVRQLRVPVVRGGPETDSPWYRSETGGNPVHAWYMGYAPVEDPQVAFAVLIEYAGIGGGPAAGPVAGHVLEACVRDGYLRPPTAATTQP